jgi:hypothetical protein
MKTKKITYITLFVLLGIILQGLIHMGFEVWYINLLVENFEYYSLGLSWPDWFFLHCIITIVFIVLGAAFGLWQGFFWWKVIYIEKHLNKLKQDFKNYLLKKRIMQKKDSNKTTPLTNKSQNKTPNKIKLVSGAVLILIFATLIAAFIIKFTYHRGFLKDCYRVCYYSKSDIVWEYRPWGYDVEFTEENRDFPSLDTCLGYCMSQKQIDFVK